MSFSFGPNVAVTTCLRTEMGLNSHRMRYNRKPNQLPQIGLLDVTATGAWNGFRGLAEMMEEEKEEEKGD